MSLEGGAAFVVGVAGAKKPVPSVGYRKSLENEAPASREYASTRTPKPQRKVHAACLSPRKGRLWRFGPDY